MSDGFRVPRRIVTGHDADPAVRARAVELDLADDIADNAGTAVTDAGLKQLAAIKSLKTVYLWNSKATEAGAKQLTASIKGLKVVLK